MGLGDLAFEFFLFEIGIYFFILVPYPLLLKYDPYSLCERTKPPGPEHDIGSVLVGIEQPGCLASSDRMKGRSYPHCPVLDLFVRNATLMMNANSKANTGTVDVAGMFAHINFVFFERYVLVLNFNRYLQLSI